MSQTTKTYRKPRLFRVDSKKMLKRGWKIISITSHKDSYHLVRGISLGLVFLPLALIGRGKSKIIVIYERAS